jgi:hypothetical protein
MQLEVNMSVIKYVLLTIVTILAGIGIWALYVIYPIVHTLMSGRM